MSAVILLGGPSGIGKTTLIDSLPEEKYARVESVTTRPQKPGEPEGKYHHVTDEEFDREASTGAFVTVDQVYGAKYAMRKSSLDAISKSKKTAIKEIHPSNHAKLKSLLPNATSVLLLPADFDAFWSDMHKRAGSSQELLFRITEDRKFYPQLRKDSGFDKVLIRTAHTSPADITKQLLGSV